MNTQRGIVVLMVVCVLVGCSASDRSGKARAVKAKGRSPAAIKAPRIPPPVPPSGLHMANLVRISDLTATVQSFNSSAYARPSKRFRTIRVWPARLAKWRVQRRANGFRVKLPLRRPVPTPAVYDGAVFVSAGFGTKQFYAFQAASGDQRWGVNIGDDGPSTPACEDGVCVFNAESCTLFGVDAETGDKLWSWWLGDPLLSAPTIASGRVFTSYPAGMTRGAGGRPPSSSHVMVALDLKSGKVLWQRWIDGDVITAPVAVGHQVYAATFSGKLYTFDQATGRVLAAHKTRATSTPIVVDGALFYTQRTDRHGRARESIAMQGGPGAVYKTLRSDRAAPYLSQRVQRQSAYYKQGKANDATIGFTTAPPSAKAGTAAKLVGQSTVANLQLYQGSRIVYFRGRTFTSMGNEVIATDPVSGQQLWTLKVSGDLRRSGGYLVSPPAAAGAYLFVSTLAGEVLQISPKKGTVVKRYAVGSPVRSQPVIHRGWIYVGTEKGELVAFNTGDHRLTGWTHWGGDARRSGLR